MSDEFEFLSHSGFYWGAVPMVGREAERQEQLSVISRVYAKDPAYARKWSNRWQNALIIAEADGDYICVDLRRDHAGEVFVASHDNDYFNGKVIAESVTAFFVEWLQTGLIMPEEPLLSLCTDGFKRPFTSGNDMVIRWKKWLRIK